MEKEEKSIDEQARKYWKLPKRKESILPGTDTRQWFHNAGLASSVFAAGTVS